MQSYKEGELVEVTTEEFVQSLYRHANWAEDEFKVRSDPAAHLGLLMTQAAAEIDRLQRDLAEERAKHALTIAHYMSATRPTLKSHESA